MRRTGLLLLFAWLVLFLLTCTPEPINRTCSDPLGTDDQIVVLNNYTCFQVNAAGCFRFKYSGGQPILNSAYDNERTFPLIYDAGEVECLGQVTSKPTQGLTLSALVELHHGYVIKMSDDTYGRLYIHSWKIENDSVKQIYVKRQYAY